MKLLSIAVPCYNSQDYMEHCVETLVSGGEEVEVIIINDGSQDETHNIAAVSYTHLTLPTKRIV